MFTPEIWLTAPIGRRAVTSLQAESPLTRTSALSKRDAGPDTPPATRYTWIWYGKLDHRCPFLPFHPGYWCTKSKHVKTFLLSDPGDPQQIHPHCIWQHCLWSSGLQLPRQSLHQGWNKTFLKDIMLLSSGPWWLVKFLIFLMICSLKPYWIAKRKPLSDSSIISCQFCS